MHAPFFSVIVTTHLRPRLLTRALGSLRAQSFQDFEIVLCADEGSSETKFVAGQCLRDRDVFICKPGTKGPADSRNAGMALANGKYIQFLDDDDSFEEGYFEVLARRLQERPSDVLYTNHTAVSEARTADGFVIRNTHRVSKLRENPKLLWVGNFIPNNSIAIASALARRVSVDARLPSHEDWDYLLGLLALANFEHFDVYGPCVHSSEDQSEHRNLVPHRHGTLWVDYLSIYRRHPAPDEEARALRLVILQRMGVHLPAHVV